MTELMDLIIGRAKIVIEGVWVEKNVIPKIDDKYKPWLTSQQTKVARERFMLRKEKNPSLYDGPAMHLSSYRKNRGVLSLNMGKFLYSQYDIAREEYRWKTMPTGIGINTVVVSSDKQIVCHKRSSEVDHKAKIGIIGSVYNGKRGIFEAMVKEIGDEVGIKSIKSIVLLGVSERTEERYNHEFSFLAQTDLSKQEISEKEKSVEKKEGELFFLEQDPKAIKEFLIQHHEDIISTSFAGLVLMGRNLWGQDWSSL